MNKSKMKGQIALFLILFLFHFQSALQAQALPDTSFSYPIDSLTHSTNSPVVGIDNGHNNYHTMQGGFSPLAKILRSDGYQVMDCNDANDLERLDILVVSNPLAINNVGNWQRPIKNAFTASEIEKIQTWVSNGGSLLLIADHMPFAGAAMSLASAFGFTFCDGFAETNDKVRNIDIFSLENQKLQIPDYEAFQKFGKIARIGTFTGSSFEYPDIAIPILTFDEADTCRQPEIAWQFDDETKLSSIDQHAQGAIMQYGKGKIALFGEAAMFTAQLYKTDDHTFRIGFNSQTSLDNIPLIRSLFYWMSYNHTNESSIETEIMNTIRQMETVFNEGRFVEVADFYTDNAQMIGNQEHVKGKEDLKKSWSQFQGDLRWDLENISIEQISDSIVIQNGYSNIYYFDKEGNEQNSRNLFSLVWIKQNSEWKIMLDHYSPR